MRSFVVLAADCTAARSILVYKRDEDKVGGCGNAGAASIEGGVATANAGVATTSSCCKCCRVEG